MRFVSDIITDARTARLYLILMLDVVYSIADLDAFESYMRADTR